MREHGGSREMFADYRRLRSAGEAVGVLAITCWALGTRLLWPALPEASPEDAAETEPENTIVTD